MPMGSPPTAEWLSRVVCVFQACPAKAPGESDEESFNMDDLLEPEAEDTLGSHPCLVPAH